MLWAAYLPRKVEENYNPYIQRIQGFLFSDKIPYPIILTYITFPSLEIPVIFAL